MHSLLDELGGRDAMEVVVVGLCERVLSDPRLAPYFGDVPRGWYELHLVEFLCAFLSDRPGAWGGRDLSAVHADLAISDREFDSFMELLGRTLDAAGVSRPLVDRVQARLERLRAQVVTIATAR